MAASYGGGFCGVGKRVITWLSALALMHNPANVRMPKHSNNLLLRRARLHTFTLAWVICGSSLNTLYAQVNDADSEATPAAALTPLAPSAHNVYQPVESMTSKEPALPPAPKAFGDSGVVVIGGSLGVTNLSFSNSAASSFSIVAQPDFDYFIGRPVSIGGYVLASYSDSKGYDYFGPLMQTKETGYGFGARMGLNITGGKFVSVWPKVSLGITHYNTTFSVLSMPASLTTTMPNQLELSTQALWVSLYVPVLFHPATHFFFGLGPSIFGDVSRSATYSGALPIDNKRTRFELTLSTGG